MALGAAVRAWGITDPGLWHDEALSHFYASQPVEWILKYSAGPINHPPLFFLLLKVWLQIGPEYSQFFVETLNLIFGVGTIGIVYRWSEQFYSRTIALWLTLITALNGFHVYYSTELRMYSLATLGLSAAGYFATRLVLDSSVQTIDLVGFVSGLLVSVYSHSFTVIPGIVMVLFVAYRIGSGPGIKRYLLGVAAFVMAYLPWGMYALNQGMKVSQDFWVPDFRFKYFGEFLLIAGGFIGPKNTSLYSIILAVVVVAGFFGPIILSLLSAGDRVIPMYWLVVSLPIIVVVAISWRDQSVFLHRIFLPLLPFMVVLVGAGVKNLPEGWGVILFSIYVIGLSSEVVLLKKNPPKQHLKEVASWIKREYRDPSLVVHDTARSYFPARFYHRGTIPELLYNGPDHFRGISPDKFQRMRTKRPIMAVYRGSIPGWVRSVPEGSIRSISSIRVDGRKYSYALLGPSDGRPGS